MNDKHNQPFSANGTESHSSPRTSSSGSPRALLTASVFFAVILASVVVVLGAFTRLADAGLGCPDWPGCYGHVFWPETADEVAVAEARFPESPVEHDKTWPEMVHRYFAGSLGLLVLALSVYSLVSRKKEASLPIKLPMFICGLIVVQAAFGMWTVTLKLWPQVVTAHLLGGFATLSLLFLWFLRLSPWRWRASAALQGLRPLALIAMVAVILQIALGGWTSSNYAAMACPDLPGCHGEWLPTADFKQGFNFLQHVGPNYLGGQLDNHARTAIHLTHRFGAVVVCVTLLILVVGLWRTAEILARRQAVVIGTILVLQIGLGLSNIIWILPLPVAVAHNAGGALLLLSLVTLNFKLARSQEELPNE